MSGGSSISARTASAEARDENQAFERELCDVLGAALEAKVSLVAIERRGEGYSWETYLVDVQCDAANERFAVKREPRAGLLGTYDVKREVELLETVRHQIGCSVPRVIAHNIANSAARAFYVMEMVAGVVPMPWDVKTVVPDADVRRRLGLEIASTMARLHAAQPASLKLTGLSVPADPSLTGLIEVDKWHAVYRECAAVRVPVLDLAFAWLRHRADCVSGRLALVHNDLRVGNVVVNHSRLAAVLDWETAEFSDPSADLAKFNLPTFRGRSRLASGLIEWPEFLDAYEQASGWRPTQRSLDYWTVLEIVKASVGGLRGSYFFETHRTDDLRYASMGWQTHHSIRWLVELFEARTWGW